jgi:hypothetical protein
MKMKSKSHLIDTKIIVSNRKDLMKELNKQKIIAGSLTMT